MLQDIVLTASALIFLVAHLARVTDGYFWSVPFAAEQALLVVLFLIRRRSQATSSRPVDWAMASVGGWLPLIMPPSGTGSGELEMAGLIVQVGGLMMTLAGFISLGRSFGVVAANRGVKTGGMYRFVRHPVYLSHTVTLTGFLLANPSVVNTLCYCAIVVAQVFRIFAEERVLKEWDEYQEYATRVRWRVIPGVF